MKRTRIRKMSKKRIRNMPKMRKWHDAVFERDDGMCVFFPEQEGTEAHHIKNRTVWPDLMYDIHNGLCVSFEGHEWATLNPEAAKLWLRDNRPDQFTYLYPDRSK